MKTVKEINLPWLVIAEIADEVYVAARFMIRDTADDYVRDRHYGHYYVMHEDDPQLELLKI